MQAFSVFGITVYRYGIFYLITFLYGYILLGYLGKKGYFKKYSGIHTILTSKLDDFILGVLLGVVIGGRLGHVFFYERSYYSTHLLEIVRLDQGGMSFIGGVLGVSLFLLTLFRRNKLTKKEFLILGDIVLCIVPVGILLGRIGNYLNQELRGKPVDQLGEMCQSVIRSLGLNHVYPLVDEQVRVNTNFIQSFFEGFVPLVILNSIAIRFLRKNIWKPGFISGMFLLIYSIVRFLVEYLKDLPSYEMIGPLSVTQRIMFLFFGASIILLSRKSV